VNEFHQKFKEYDVILSPSFGGVQLLLTNLVGTPCLVLPNGFNTKGSPTSISFLGRLDGEAAILLLAQAYQEATTWDEQAPPFFK
jgi:Asp-tRNA(Asn)/Glu-tRNA(Gln) amidotransferase A subunit family amidase